MGIAGFPLAYDPDERRTKEYLLDEAALDECELLLPDEYTIQLDLDEGYSEEVLHMGLQIISRVMEIQIVDDYPSRGGNRHVVITTGVPISDIERVAIQAFLGSDPRREALHWMRIRQGIPYPCSLFKPLNGYGGPEGDVNDGLEDLF